MINELPEATEMAAQYAEAKPFPHIVIDSFLLTPHCEEITANIPGIDNFPWFPWHIYGGENSRNKLASQDLTRFHKEIQSFFQYCNSAAFLMFLESLTGISGLIPDPYLRGGGIHRIKQGGFLNIHADFNVHTELKLDRRINLLLFLNRDWKEEYGGHLELWNRGMTECVQSILPVFNRCVIFNTTDVSFHGHPGPLTCPDDRTRDSLAVYYYTVGRPESERSSSHSTLYQERPQAMMHS